MKIKKEVDVSVDLFIELDDYEVDADDNTIHIKEVMDDYEVELEVELDEFPDDEIVEHVYLNDLFLDKRIVNTLMYEKFGLEFTSLDELTKFEHMVKAMKKYSLEYIETVFPL